MTDREKAIVMAYTGYTMLTGDKLGLYYQYIQEKVGRPVMTHELAEKPIQETIHTLSKPDFVELCRTNDEPRVMTLEEIHGRMNVWLEYIEKNEVVLAIGGDSCGGAKCFITEYDESVALKDRQYNIRWRAWTQRPTRAQMEATPWHSEERAGE